MAKNNFLELNEKELSNISGGWLWKHLQETSGDYLNYLKWTHGHIYVGRSLEE